MIETLLIRDYALIELLHIEFSPGFNVLTGETGAGKSIIVGALSLALGGRASTEVIRSGTSKALVEVVFRLKNLPPALATLFDELELQAEEHQIILARSISSDGRSRAMVNGRVVPVAVLAAIGDELVDLHGQHEHQSLLKPSCQLRLLDAFAGSQRLAAAVQDQFREWCQLNSQIEKLESDDKERARQLDFLQHEWREIDKASLIPGEEEEIRDRLRVITHAETIHQLASQAYAILYDSEPMSALDALNSALSNLEKIESFDSQFSTLIKDLIDARTSIESVASDLRRYTRLIEYDPEEINHLNERLALISALKRKYGDDIPAILAYRDQVSKKIAEYEERDSLLESLLTRCKAIYNAMVENATTLSSLRRDAAKQLSERTEEVLRELDMPSARLEVRLEESELGPSGIDKVEFMLSANAGESPKPLRYIASGGEISRIMLALKSVFAEQDTVPTLVFDEIDTGIGGATARRVADHLASLSEKRQVLCITHLAQIAAPAKMHFMVSKKEEQGLTQTVMNVLENGERKKEIARLLDGSVSAASLEHAKALLAEFHQ